MAKSRIHRTYNLPEQLILEAEKNGLDAISTGGNMDYICKVLGKNLDGSPRVALLCSARESGSPDRLSERSEIEIMLSETWDSAIGIPAGTAKEAMAIMATMYDPYAG